MSWVTDLKVGDRVFMESRGDLAPYKVTKVTPKSVVVEYWRFRRDDGRQIGGDTYFHHNIYQPTEEIEIKYRAAHARAFLRNVPWSKLSHTDAIKLAGDVRALLPKDDKE